MLWLAVSVIGAHAANPSFQDFSTNQFSVTGNKVVLRAGAVVTNLTLNTFTILGDGTNYTTYHFPLTNCLTGQFLAAHTNGNDLYFYCTNLPTSTVVFDTVEQLVATPIPLPGIGLLAYVRDPLRGGPLAFYPNSVDTTNRFDTYASLDGPGNWKRPPDPNTRVEWGAVTGFAVTNETLVAALTLQSARAVGKVVYSGTDEFLHTSAVPLLDNNILFFEDGAQATGLRLTGNGKTNITIIGAGFVAAVAGTTIPAVALTNCANVAIQVASVTGYTAAPYALSGTTGINFLDSLNRPWTPQAFGAMGDALADDTVAVQAAFTLRGMGRRGEVVVPTGTYRITDSLTFPSLLVLRGEGRGRSILQFDPSANDKALILLDNGADNIVIQDLGFYRLNSNVRSGISGIERIGAGGSGGRITGCRITTFNKYAIHIDSPMYFRIQDCDIWGTQRTVANDGDGLAAGDGILFTTFATTSEISLNRFSDNDHCITIPVNNGITISGNSFETDGSTGNFTTDQIHVEAYGAFTFTGNYTEAERTATNQAVLTLYGGSGATVTGNVMVGDVGGTLYSHILLHFKGTNYGQNVKGNSFVQPLQFFVDNDSPSQIVDLTENSYQTPSGVTRDYAIIKPLLSGEYFLWPVAQGGVNTVLQNAGDGELSWAIPGAGTSGNWNASGTTNSTLAGVASANGAIFTNAIGIGATPSFQLDVQPPTGIAIGRIKSANDDAELIIDGALTTDRAFLDFRLAGTQRWTVGNLQSVNFSISPDTTQSASRFYIERSTGFVGIDTEAPAQKLDVNGNIQIPKDGVLLFGTTNILFMSGGHLVYTNGTSESMFEVRGQGSAVGAIFGLNLGGNTIISSPGTVIYLPENLLVTGFIQPGADNTYDIGANGSGGAWQDGWFKGKLNVENLNDGSTNYARGQLFMGVSNVVTLEAVSGGDGADNISINFVPLGTGTVQINGVPIGGGTGDFVGPASSTDNAIVRHDGTTGKLGQNSVVTISDAGAVAGVASLLVSNTVSMLPGGGFFTDSGSWTDSQFLPGVYIDLEGNRITNSLSINNVVITAPAATSTLTIGSGKTATISNTLTFTGTDASSVAFGAGGTVSYSGHAHAGEDITSGTVADARIASTLTRDTEWDTIAEIETATSVNILVATEIDTLSEADALMQLPVEIGIAASDETTVITTGTAKVTFRAPYAFTVTAVRMSLTTVSSSGLPTVDINETGTTILSTKLTCDVSEKTSTTAAAAAVISDSAIADDAEITIDFDVAGTGATGVKIWILGYR